MTAAPTWSILVPTLGERRPLFDRLMAGLLPQVERHGGAVQVVAWHNNGAPSLPKIRQALVTRCQSEYLSFVDDDDLVAPSYVDDIVAALATRPDYVGFQLQCYTNGKPIAVAYHSLEFRRWRNLPGRFERDISHINPIRTVLARRADFAQSRAGGAEDRAWAEQLRRSRVLRSQVVIPRILYHYLHTTPDGETGSRWKNPAAIRPGDCSTVASPYLTWSHDD